MTIATTLEHIFDIVADANDNHPDRATLNIGTSTRIPYTLTINSATTFPGMQIGLREGMSSRVREVTRNSSYDLTTSSNIENVALCDLAYYIKQHQSRATAFHEYMDTRTKAIATVMEGVNTGLEFMTRQYLPSVDAAVIANTANYECQQSRSIAFQIRCNNSCSTISFQPTEIIDRVGNATVDTADIHQWPVTITAHPVTGGYITYDNVMIANVLKAFNEQPYDFSNDPWSIR
jgi:hypothetical protein